MVRIDSVTKLKLLQWIHRNPIYRFFYIYVGTLFMTIHMLFKYKFDFDIISTKISQLRKDARYEFQKLTIKNRDLNQRLEELKKNK